MNFTLTVQPRELQGRKVKRLRAKQIVPGNIYGAGFTSKPIQMSSRALLMAYREVGFTGLIDLYVEGQKTKIPALISSIQQHPVTDYPIHVDFRKVNLRQKLSATVPLEFVGESPAVKSGGIFNTLIHEIEVEALPQDFPDQIEIDISSLVEINDQITIADIKIDTSKLEIELDPETVIAKVESQRIKEIEENPEPIETEIIGEKSDESADSEENSDSKASDEE